MSTSNMPSRENNNTYSKDNEEGDENDVSDEPNREMRSLVDDLDDEDLECKNDCKNDSSSSTISGIKIMTNSSGQPTTDYKPKNQEENEVSMYTNAPNTSQLQNLPVENTQDRLPILSTDISSEVTASVDLPMSNPLRFTSTSAPFLLNQSLKPPQGWDQLVRSGTRIKTLVSDAIDEVKNSMALVQTNKRKRMNNNDVIGTCESPLTQSRVVAVADFTVELAREKTAQVMQLQRDAQAQAAAIQAANSSLREETCSGQSRLDRTVEALRIASNNAAKARADADAAEAKASNLAQTLQNLHTVLAETKSAAQILHQEQQTLNDTVAKVESKLIKKEAELFSAKNEIATLRLSNESMENMKSKLMKDREMFESKVKQSEREVEELRREKVELENMEKARKERSNKVEEEWRKTQTLLIEATSGQVATKRAQALLEETISSLQKANEDLHVAMTEQQRIARDDKNRLTETLGKVEQEAQRLRIAAEATNEEIARLKANKASNEKQIQQLKSRLSIAERSLKEVTLVPLATTPASTNVSPMNDVATPMNSSIIPNQLSFHLPPLSGTGKKMSTSTAGGIMPTPTITDKENIGVNKGELCCICYKPNMGIMKLCQCGSTTCNKKAHMNCIKFLSTQPAGLSVSHPGTPAPKLPVVLCDSVISKLRTNNNSSNNNNNTTTATTN